MDCTAELSADLDAYLIGFVRRDLLATEQFISVAEPYLLNLARNFGFDLPRDLHNEIVEQTYVILLDGAGAKFNSQRGTAKAFLYDVARNATLQVRAQYCPPGQPTRNRRLRTTTSFSGDIKKMSSVIIPIDEVKELAASHNSAHEIMTRCDARMVLVKAPYHIAAILHRLYFNGETLGEIARQTGVNRFKLKRLVNTYFVQLRRAA